MPELSPFSVHFQPERPLIDQLEAALASHVWTHIDVPIAYAVSGGVRLLEERLSQDPKWSGLGKRFLVGIDWFRSEPTALDALAALPSSELRIVDGLNVVNSAGCHPSRSYHPKAFIFRRVVPGAHESCGCLVGSGNLSRNGLTFGRELDLWVASGPQASPEVLTPLAELRAWFDALWDASPPYDAIRDAYRNRFVPNQGGPARAKTEDDTVPVALADQRGLKPDDLVLLRSLDHFWVDTGSMYSNLGHDKSGNQIDLKRYTRVFFGFPATDLAPNSAIGGVDVVFGGVVYPDRHLRYGDNGMDKFDLPVPGGDAAEVDYRNRTLLFTRFADEGGRVRYRLEILTSADRRTVLAQSRSMSTLFSFGGGSTRQFGAF